MASHFQRGWTVPGFGLPLRWPEMQYRTWQPLTRSDNNTLLLSAFDASENPKYCYTIRERTMLALINELTDIPDWDRKIFDPNFVFEWKSVKLMTGQDVTRSMADWCAEEVKYYVQDFMISRIIPAINGGIIKSDDCVDLSLKGGVQRAAAALRKEAVRPRGSNNQVEDILDPYLYPFVFGRTKTLNGLWSSDISRNDCISRCGEGEPARTPPERDCIEEDPAKYPNDMAWSRRYQWLPFDVVFGNNGKVNSRITSYINNVHPTTHHALYNVTEHLIDILTPFFNRTLVDLKESGYQNQRMHLAKIDRDPVILREPETFRPPEQRAYRQYLDGQDRYQHAIFVDLRKEFWNIGVQMILQMQDIDLNPESPEFKGEEWHVQGQTNERICTTAYYVYSAHNLRPSALPSLSFRCRIHPEEALFASGQMGSPPFAEEMYGAKNGDPVIQQMGDITLREGRVVVFPNTFQMKLNPFSLADSSRPGHCRILILYLLDPNRRNMSTAMVPCQRRDWWAKEVRQKCARLRRLPMEIFHSIVSMVDDYPISLEEAEHTRQEFKEEREEFRKRHTKAMIDYLEWDFGHYHHDDWVHL